MSSKIENLFSIERELTERKELIKYIKNALEIIHRILLGRSVDMYESRYLIEVFTRLLNKYPKYSEKISKNIAKLYLVLSEVKTEFLRDTMELINKHRDLCMEIRKDENLCREFVENILRDLEMY